MFQWIHHSQIKSIASTTMLDLKGSNSKQWILTFGNRSLSAIGGGKQLSRLAGWGNFQRKRFPGPLGVPPAPPCTRVPERPMRTWTILEMYINIGAAATLYFSLRWFFLIITVIFFWNCMVSRTSSQLLVLSWDNSKEGQNFQYLCNLD